MRVLQSCFVSKSKALGATLRHKKQPVEFGIVPLNDINGRFGVIREQRNQFNLMQVSVSVPQIPLELVCFVILN